MPRIKRIREVRLPAGQSMVGALVRGDVTLIDHVPPDQVARLAASANIKVGSYAQPVIHMIALDGRNQALRNRSLRRALSYAIDRKGLLEDHLLKRAATDKDNVADGVFPKGNYADAPAVKPLEFQPWLAKMLVVAARKELGGQPIKLNFEFPAVPEIAVMARKLADAFRAAGIEIAMVEVLPSRLETELRSGRTFELAYRVLRCDEPVFDAGPLLCPGYEAPPDAGALASTVSPEILQLLLRLERASAWPTARGLVIQIDRESRDELPVIPLWQVADHYALARPLEGPDDVRASALPGNRHMGDHAMDRQRSLENTLSLRQGRGFALGLCAALVLLGSPRAGAQKSAATTPISPATEAIERRPYRILFNLGFDPSTRIDERMREAIIREWQVLTRRFIGVAVDRDDC